MYSENIVGDAIDLSHHLSTLGQNRNESPLKFLQKYWGKQGMISLAGGLPSPEYFPFETVKADALVFDKFPLAPNPFPQSQGAFSWLWGLFSGSKGLTTAITIPKYTEDPNDLNLATALQYSLATGMPQLTKFCLEFTTKIYKPAYTNFTTLLHAGNTDGWAKTVSTLCNTGEGVLSLWG